MGASCPKQLLGVAGQTVLAHTLERLERAFAPVGMVGVVVGHPEWLEEMKRSVAGILQVGWIWCEGGMSRQESVLKGLLRLPESCRRVFIHDAARCCLDMAWLGEMERGSRNLSGQGRIPVYDLADSVVRVREGQVAGYERRSDLRLVQTPQCFPFPEILSAHLRAKDVPGMTDDGSVWLMDGGVLLTVPGHPDNRKLTRPEDRRLMEEWLLLHPLDRRRFD